METSPLEYAKYPMGPALAKLLGVRGDGSPSTLTPKDWERFERAIVPTIAAQEWRDPDDVANVLEELVMMKLPQAALAVAEGIDQILLKDDFRCCLAVGSAALLLQEFSLGEEFFIRAQSLVPQEIAPYTNLAEILYRTHRDHDCMMWVEAGLKVEPNNRRLWELLGYIYFDQYVAQAGTQLRELASKHGSWAGLSLAAQYTDPQDTGLRAQWLEDIYHQGNRDVDFLIELTAALGLALHYEKIPAIVWEADKKGTIPWQLHAHAAQAYLALNNEAMAKTSISKALKDTSVAPAQRAEMQTLLDELNNSESTSLPH